MLKSPWRALEAEGTIDLVGGGMLTWRRASGRIMSSPVGARRIRLAA